ncbi:hypothetical protein niasHT_033733 [Heterodera trifolii]|uniref:Serpin domain-containing protein n=1 Tax=Heterodera trifolii TaxID=157864 RepID=A0ABD2ICI3_9BILA
MGAPESEVHKYFGALLKSVANGQNSSNTLETVNKMYVKDGLRMVNVFMGQIEQNYGGQLETVEFGDSKGTAEMVLLVFDSGDLDSVGFDSD